MIKRIVTYALAVAITLLCSTGAYGAGINKNFMKKAAKKVWAMDSEGIFDATVEIPDSLAESFSAVVIARHDAFTGDRVENNTIYTASGRTNRTVLNHIRRSMVKLLDESAVEEYGTFEFGGPMDKHSYSIFLYTVDQAFGARVHKPDGSVHEVDISNALEVSDGKKGDKNRHYKLAIPGLETGDVLEYFYYTESANDEGDVELVDVMLTDRYPVMARLMTGTFDPTLTIEFKSYNGAPVPERGKNGDKNTARIFITNVPAIESRKYLYEERQLPFVRLNTINNHDVAGTYTVRAPNSRSAGIYFNIPGNKIQTETMENVVRLAYKLWKLTKPISPVPRKATNMVKDYAKAHPDADARELADVAFMAVRYQNLIGKEEDTFTNSLILSLFHNEVMENLKLYEPNQTGLAFANGRDEVSIDDMSKWNQATFMSLVDGVPYDLNAPLYYAPQEIPALFQDVPAISITGKIRDHTYEEGFQKFTLPDRKAGGNRATYRTTVSLPEGTQDCVHIHHEAELAGSAKATVDEFTDYMEWIGAVEDFFDIKDGKRYTDKTYSSDQRKRDLHKAITEYCHQNMGADVDSVLNFEIIDRGITPNNTELKYVIDCEAPDLAEDLGDALSIKIGKLAGNNSRLNEHDRDRILDVLLPSAMTEIQVITLKVPDGYAVDETSLEALGRQTVNSVGQFIVQPSINEDGDVEIQCVQRVRVHSLAHQAWPMLRDLLDAAAEFTDASLLIKHK